MDILYIIIIIDVRIYIKWLKERSSRYNQEITLKCKQLNILK